MAAKTMLNIGYLGFWTPCMYIMYQSRYIFTIFSIDKSNTTAFSHAAPSVWNNLPVDYRRSESFGRFRTQIRTLYFRLAFID